MVHNGAWRRHICTKQSSALMFTMLSVVFLIVAVSSPMYRIQQTLEASDTTTVIEFWWRGMYITNEGDTTIVNWDDPKAFQTERPKVAYMLSASFASAALGLNSFICVAILFSLVIPATRVQLERFTSRFLGGGGLKWFIFLLSAAALVLTIVSWGIFLEFPDCLEDAEFCPAQVSDIQGEDLWCSSFIGSRDVSNGQRQEVKVSWFPYVGWIFTAVATGPCVLVTMLLGFVKRSIHYSGYEHLVNG